MTKPKVSKLRIKEKDLVKSILDYLNARKIFCWRHNTGGFMKENHFYRFGDLGSCDIFALKDGKLYGIEAKGTEGKQSEGQKDYQKRFEKAGGNYLLCYLLDDVINNL